MWEVLDLRLCVDYDLAAPPLVDAFNHLLEFVILYLAIPIFVKSMDDFINILRGELLFQIDLLQQLHQLFLIQRVVLGGVELSE